jgi:mRNA interferase MazF
MMPSTISFEFGDVVLVPFPFTDQSTTKQRPAVVVSSAAYHRDRRDLIILAVTSQIRPAAGFGEAVIQRWESAGLLKPSMLKPLIATLERPLVMQRLGRLDAEDVSALRRVLDEILGP